jgi:opacity protein-like surface antigen
MLLFVLVCPSAYGEGGSSGSDEWEFTVTPYLWAAGLDGNATVRGRETSIDASFSDIFENLDFGGMVHFEARKGKWGFFFDPTYMKFSADGDFGPRGGVDVDVEAEMALVELGILYRLLERPVGNENGRFLSLDLLGGGRYIYLKGELDIGGIIDVEVDKSKDWLDAIVGGRIQIDLAERLTFSLRGDAGGFDIGSSSDLTWNLSAALGYELSERTTLWVGYRHLDIDYDDGSDFELDVDMSGPVIGVAFQF